MRHSNHYKHYFLLLFALAVMCSQSYAQSYGPYYVSKQNPVDKTLQSGSETATADEGRVINITITADPPLTISPKSYNLTGPPCPTYNEHGARTPKEVQSPATDNVSGSVIIKAADFPEAGTTVNPTITGVDNGYWTNCYTGEQHSYSDQPQTVSFEIVSIKVSISGPDSACKGAKIKFKADGYPGDGGTYTWSNGQTGQEVEYTLDQTTEVSVTYTIGDESYKDSKTVKVIDPGGWQPQVSKGFDIPGLSSFTDAMNNLAKCLPGNVTIKGPSVNFTVKAKNCCKDGEVKTLGQKEATGSVTMSLNAEDIPLASPPWTGKFEKSYSKFGYQIGVEAEYGLFLSLGTTVSGGIGYKLNSCDNTNCFTGNAGFNMSATLAAKVGGNACLKGAAGTCTQCKGMTKQSGGTERCKNCTLNLCGYCWQHTDQSWWCVPCPSFNVNVVSIGTSFSGGVSYNKADCNEGLNCTLDIGGVTITSGFNVFGYDFKFSYDVCGPHNLFSCK